MTAPRGIIVREAHFPGRAPLEAYGNGGFRFAGMSHRGAILCLPSGVYGWEPLTTADLDEAAFERLRAEAVDVELLLLGTGPDLVRIPDALRWTLSSIGVRVETMATGGAVRTYNVLLAEGRAVAAGLLPVD